MNGGRHLISGKSLSGNIWRDREDIPGDQETYFMRYLLKQTSPAGSIGNTMLRQSGATPLERPGADGNVIEVVDLHSGSSLTNP